jgi:hypothetical protein
VKLVSIALAVAVALIVGSWVAQTLTQVAEQMP